MQTINNVFMTKLSKGFMLSALMVFLFVGLSASVTGLLNNGVGGIPLKKTNGGTGGGQDCIAVYTTGSNTFSVFNNEKYTANILGVVSSSSNLTVNLSYPSGTAIGVGGTFLMDITVSNPNTSSGTVAIEYMMIVPGEGKVFVTQEYDICIYDGVPQAPNNPIGQ